jgi:hypothetical protein
VKSAIKSEMTWVQEWRSEFYTTDGHIVIASSYLDDALETIHKLMPGALYRKNGAHENIYIFDPDFAEGRLCGYIFLYFVPVQFSRINGSARPLLTRLPRHRRPGPGKHITLMFTASPTDDSDRVLESSSVRERAVLDGLVQGRSNKLIGEAQGSKNTIRKDVYTLASRSGINTARDPQITLARRFCRLAPRAVCNDEAQNIWESWNDIKKECMMGVLNNCTTEEIADAVGRKPGTVQKYLSAMMQDLRGPFDPDSTDGTRLQLVAWYMANFFPPIKRLNVVKIELETWTES